MRRARESSRSPIFQGPVCPFSLVSRLMLSPVLWGGKAWVQVLGSAPSYTYTLGQVIPLLPAPSGKHG